MKNSKKVCAYDKVIIALNADNEEYWSYERSINGNLIGNVFVHCLITVKF